MCVFLFFFTFFYLNINDFFFAVYSLTRISSIVPFSVVATALWGLLIFGGFAVLAALRDVRQGAEWVIVCLPMSALPFIFLGVPLGALNSIFICRALVNVFVYVLFMKWFLDVTLRRKPVLKFPLFSTIGLFVMIYFFNIIFADPDIRYKIGQSIFIVISCVLFFYLIINIIRDEQALKKILEIMVLACIVQVLMSSFSFFYYLIIKHQTVIRVEGMLRDYELFAEYLAIHIPLFIFLLRNPGALIPKKALKFFLILTIFVLLATATRGAIISLGFGLMYYLSKIKNKVKITGVMLQVLAWGVTIGIVLVALYKFLPASAHIIERFSGMNLSTMDTRQFVWMKFWDYFIEKPVAGHGIVYDLGSYLFFPHSTYFYYLLTLGIPGLLGYLMLVFSVLMKGFRNVRMASSNEGLSEMAIVLNALLVVLKITFLIDLKANFGLKFSKVYFKYVQLFYWGLLK
jgi:O-antigen ligase